MSCSQCGTKYNFFHKEMGCSSCGLSFCGKCTRQKCKVPSKGNEELNVCRTCFAKLTAGINQSKRPPPDVFLKRLEHLENPAAPPITVYKTDPKIEKLRSGLAPVDQKILERLENLKDGKAPIPTDSEIMERLKNLKGENEYVEGTSQTKPLYTVDTRTDHEKVDSLLEQFVTEQDIELSHQNLDGIEARVAELRERGVRPNESSYIKNLHDSSGSEEEINKITKKVMDEVSLDEKLPPEFKDKPKSKEETLGDFGDELPWCVLCNNDARYRCLDCSGDLYCSSCNVEVHKTWGDSDHRVIPYKPSN